VKNYLTTYIADGTKASAVDSANKGFDYLGSFVYVNDNNARTFESTNFGGGRINRTGTNAYDINYFITDHLGSTRVIVDNNGEIKEQKDFYPFGKEHENSNLMNSTNRWGYNGKEKQIVYNLNFLDYINRMYDDFICRWTTQDPLQEKRPWISSYVFCSNNPVGRTDPNGLLDDLVITGDLAKVAFDELQKSVSKELTLSMDTKGNVSYTQNNLDKSLSAETRQLTTAIDDYSVTVNVKAENTTQTSTGNLYIGGAFMGNEVTQVFPGFEGNTSSNSVNIVNANQEVNPKRLGNVSDAHGKHGTDMLHEVTEAYQGAKISQSTGISSPIGGQAGSVYSQAHRAATPQSGKIFETIYNNKGKVLQMLPNGKYPANVAKVEWWVNGQNNNRKIIQTLP
jgi:RHS repeat-associated protein